MYEQQNPFKLTDFITMSNFLNQFLYKGILNNLFGKLLPQYPYHIININIEFTVLISTYLSW